MRTYSPSPTVVAPGIPLYQMGFLDAEARRHGARRRSHAPAPTVNAPRTPLYLQGWSLGDYTSQSIQAGAAVGSRVATSALTSSGTIAAGSLAIPLIGAGIAIVGSIIAGLWAAHAARAKGAQTENAAVSSAVQAFDGGMKAIFDAANSNDSSKNISASQAASAVQQLYTQFWQGVCPFTTGPGRADTSNCGASCGGPTSTSSPCAGMPYGHKCDKSCTVSCCVGCQDIKPSVDMAIAVFQAGGGTVQVCNVAGDHYGLSSRGSYSLTYTKPTIAQSAGGILSSITGGGGASFLSPTGGGSILPLLAVAALAIFAVRSL